MTENIATPPVTAVTEPRLTWLRNLTLGQAQDFHAQGGLTQDEFEAFMHAWSTSAVRFGGFEAWEPHEFANAQVENIATTLGCCTVLPYNPSAA